MIVILKEPTKEPKVIEIENELEALQAAVDGYIEVLPMPGTRILMICDEEGKLKDKEPNFALLGADHVSFDVIVGTTLFVGDNGDGDFRDLTAREIGYVQGYLHSSILN